MSTPDTYLADHAPVAGSPPGQQGARPATLAGAGGGVRGVLHDGPRRHDRDRRAPSIKSSLHVADTTLQWVLIAYTITFGGLLLLGGRAADLLGRRRMFMIGVTIFSAASLACGLANTIGVLIAARAVQGVGAAIVSPAVLSIIMTTFHEGAERNKALGIWGAIGGSGAAAGVLFGGVLTKYAGWEWIFFVNVPVGVLVLALTRPFVRESLIRGLERIRRRRRGHDHVQPLAARLRDLEGARRRLGDRPHDRTADRLRGALPLVPRDRDAEPLADGQVRHLPHPQA